MNAVINIIKTAKRWPRSAHSCCAVSADRDTRSVARMSGSAGSDCFAIFNKARDIAPLNPVARQPETQSIRQQLVDDLGDRTRLEIAKRARKILSRSWFSRPWRDDAAVP
jgi:hypothetical protein